MSRRTGIEITEADVPEKDRAEWRLKKQERDERMAIKADLSKREIELPDNISIFDLVALRAFHENAENTPQGRYAAIRKRFLEGKIKKIEDAPVIPENYRSPYKD